MTGPQLNTPTCSECGTVAESGEDGVPPLDWSADLSAGAGPRWCCAQCTRRFVRSIEAKLDHGWW